MERQKAVISHIISMIAEIPMAPIASHFAKE